MVNNKSAKRIVEILSIILFFTCSSELSAQAVTSVIPYEVYGGKMIVRMSVNGNEERMIFDTGAGKSSLTTEFCRKNNLVAVDSIPVTDVNSNKSYYKQTQLASIVPPDGKINFKGLKVVIMSEPSPVKCFDVIGFIGSDFMSKLICIIDSKAKTITLTSAEVQSGESLRYSHNFTGGSSLPIFDMVINGEDVTTLFDTGSGPFLSIKNSDYDLLKSKDAITLIREGYGGRSIGLSGISTSSAVLRTGIDNIRIGPAKFSNVKAETMNSPHTLLGLRSLEYAKVVIDYPRRRFYYIPYTTDAVSPEFRNYNFNLSVNEGKLIIGTVWEDFNKHLSEGDLVTHINGKPTGVYDFCNSIINGIEELKGPDIKILTVQTKSGKNINIEYKRD